MLQWFTIQSVKKKLGTKNFAMEVFEKYLIDSDVPKNKYSNHTLENTGLKKYC